MVALRRRVAAGDGQEEIGEEREEKSVEEDSPFEEAPDWDPKLGEKFKNDVGSSLPRRLFHWGPLIALFLIFYIGITATWLSLSWWPIYTLGGFIHLLIFLQWNCLALVNMLAAAWEGGGYLPLGWEPDGEDMGSHLQWCGQCKGFKAPRAHHCSKCGRCVLKMDHHCPWINNCVGHRNHAHFVFFLASASTGCVHACVIIIASLNHAVHLNWYLKYAVDDSFPIVQVTLHSFLLSILACAFSAGVAVAVGVLLYIQLKEIAKNRTALEDYIVSKAESRRERDESLAPFVYPYDLGWKRNFKEVLGGWGLTRGNGVWWPTLKKTHQFTLTEEQLRQKMEKKERARVVEITHDYKGGWWRALSLGPKTFFCQPLSEEARVAIKVKERWTVTRGSKGWVYGRRGEGEEEVKGWFPRRYALFIEEESDEE